MSSEESNETFNETNEIPKHIPEEYESVKDLVENENTIDLKMSDIDPGEKFGYPEDDLTNNLDGTLGLEDLPSPEELAECRELAIEELGLSLYNEDLNLDTDLTTIEGQNYVVVSFVGPEFSAKSDINGFRIMGVFEELGDAKEHIQTLTDEEKIFDTGLIEMYKFVPSYPLKNHSETQEEQDKFLNDIIVNYKIERETAKQIYEKRKSKLMLNKKRIIEKERKEPLKPKEDQEVLIEDIKKPNIDDNDEIPRNPTHARLLKKKALLRKEKEAKELELKTKKVNINTKFVSNKLDGQNYAAITFVGNDIDQKNKDRCAMKVRGIFNTYDECSNFCKELIEIDDTYDILVADLYKWLPCSPDVEKIEQVHTKEQLNTMYQAHEKESKNVKKIHNDKKHEITSKHIEVSKETKPFNIQNMSMTDVNNVIANLQNSNETKVSSNETKVSSNEIINTSNKPIISAKNLLDSLSEDIERIKNPQ